MPRPRRSEPGGPAAAGAAAGAPSPVETAIRFLARRRRFESEVRSHLRVRGVPGPAADEAVARLRELDLLSDADTCRAWIRDRLRFSPRSRAAVRRELLKRGASEEVVERALDESFPVDEEVDVAVDVLRRSSRRLHGLPEARARHRMWSALGRRGFDPDTVREAIRRYLEGRDEREET